MGMRARMLVVAFAVSVFQVGSKRSALTKETRGPAHESWRPACSNIGSEKSCRMTVAFGNSSNTCWLTRP